MSAAERWRASLARWAIPDEILALAPESPWIHPPELFGVPDVIEESPSHERAREALPDGGTVLDVGCGGGVAAFALTPPAAHVIGVDQQPRMLEMFRAAATQRGVACETIEGSWPEAAADAPRADVVTGHHVAYNVGDIVPFLRAMDHHARRRVVLELPDRHPLSSMNGAWRHFWNLERPDVPDTRRPHRRPGRDGYCGAPRAVARWRTNDTGPADRGPLPAHTAVPPRVARRGGRGLPRVVAAAARPRVVDDLVGHAIAQGDVIHLVGFRPAICDLRPGDFGRISILQT